jgi:hypothetical protein
MCTLVILLEQLEHRATQLSSSTAHTVLELCLEAVQQRALQRCRGIDMAALA